LGQLQQFTGEGKKVAFDDEGNPHEVYELTEAVIPLLGLLSSILCRSPPSSNLQHIVARAFSDAALLQRGANH
jgi:hypothetical protein